VVLLTDMLSIIWCPAAERRGCYRLARRRYRRSCPVVARPWLVTSALFPILHLQVSPSHLLRSARPRAKSTVSCPSGCFLSSRIEATTKKTAKGVYSSYCLLTQYTACRTMRGCSPSQDLNTERADDTTLSPQHGEVFDRRPRSSRHAGMLK
jgi:hypothetical protein